MLFVFSTFYVKRVLMLCTFAVNLVDVMSLQASSHRAFVLGRKSSPRLNI